MAIRVDITSASDYFTGEDKDLHFTIYQADEVTAQDITGWSINWMVKARRTDADALALISAAATPTTPSGGICDVALNDTDIAALVGEKRYWHELKRIDGGNETVLSYGSFTLNQAVHD